MTATLVEVLGPVRARVDGTTVEVTSPTQRLVLAILAAAGHRAVSRDRLTDAVWPEGPPPSAGNSLNSHLSRLRRLLGDGAIERVGTAYRLTAATDADGLDADPALASTGELGSALRRWRGRPFGELADHPALLGAERELTDARQALRRHLAGRLDAAGDHEAACRELRALLGDEPTDEAAWIALMGSLIALDRRAEALRAAQDARRQLVSVGLGPGPALVTVEREALRVDLGTTPSVDDDLVGRDDELRALRRALARHRWITVIGPGGVGKSRLVRALGLAPGSVVSCDLATVADGADVDVAVARALGVRPVPPIADRIVEALREQPRVLVLDGCEHHLDEVRRVAMSLRRLDPGRVIATSRSPITVEAERLIELGPLTEAAAVELLHRRVTEADEPVADDDVAAALCRRVDHLPLGIELVASSLRLLDAGQLLERLDDTIDLLWSGGRPERHRSLRATVESSIELLAEAEREALLHLSLFAGPFTVDRSEALLVELGWSGDAVPAVLAGLRDASLLHAADGPTGRRLALLDTVRAVAADHLLDSGRSSAGRTAHVAVAVARAHAIASGIVDVDEGRWAAIADAELADLRLAVERAADEGDHPAAATIVTSLFQYAYDRIHPEIGGWADELLTLADDGGELRVSAALGAFQVGQLDRAMTLAGAAVDSADDETAARARIVASNVEIVRGHLDDAIDHAEQAAASAGALPYLYGLSQLLIAVAAHYADDPARADEARRRLRDLPIAAMTPTVEAYRHYVEAELDAASDPVGARRHVDAALAAARSVGSTLVEGVALVTSASLAVTEDPRAARAAFRRTIGHWSDRPEHNRQWTTLRNHAVALTGCGELRTAARILGAADAHAPPAYGTEAHRLAGVRSDLLAGLGADLDAELRASGAASTLDEIVELCLSGD
ncbi:MAG: BTAD domain-containing putative transcriptional regulator [Actinomycetota bacterium]